MSLVIVIITVIADNFTVSTHSNHSHTVTVTVTVIFIVLFTVTITITVIVLGTVTVMVILRVLLTGVATMAATHTVISHTYISYSLSRPPYTHSQFHTQSTTFDTLTT